ncbi:MAG: cation:dicarboxylase symporter family transporter [Candidatus Ancillula sp.]|jgi:aerobic C4-dicarboxylate transport protein|nr:cation:dicarboxylase symporter family transporter [Candidatus Ancillula sp.]
MRIKQLFGNLYLQVIFAVILGVLVGIFIPSFGEKCLPLGSVFIFLIKIVIVPIIFCCITHGVASIGNLKSLGKIGIKAIIYFEVLTTIALIIGLVVVDGLKPGSGMNIDPDKLDKNLVESYTQSSVQSHNSILGIIQTIFPKTFFESFFSGNLLHTLAIGLLFGVAILKLHNPRHIESLVNGLNVMTEMFFSIMNIVMRFAPFGVFGAIAYTISSFGSSSLIYLLKMMVCVYLTSILFILVCLGLILRFCGVNIFKFLRFIATEIILVLGTSSSEVAIPSIISKFSRSGVDPSIVRLVIPMGYSFNLDGTCIYLTSAILFISQSMNIDLTFGNKILILVLLLLTSKGAAAVSGGGFITLAATLSSFSLIPVVGITIILGVDRFMSEIRSITNIIGNCVATVVVAKWEKKIDMEEFNKALNRKSAKL